MAKKQQTSVHERLFDVRAVDRYIKKDYVDAKQYDEHLSALDDAGDNYKRLEVDQAEFIAERSAKRERRQNEENDAADEA